MHKVCSTQHYMTRKKIILLSILDMVCVCVCVLRGKKKLTNTHTRTHARTHARTYTYARTHTHTHTSVCRHSTPEVRRNTRTKKLQDAGRHHAHMLFDPFRNLPLESLPRSSDTYTITKKEEEDTPVPNNPYGLCGRKAA